MMNLGFFLLLSMLPLHGTVAEDAQSETLPAFCGKHKCPKYQLIKQHDKFEHRLYDPTNWVTTNLKLDIFGLGMAISFKRLFDYINGANSEGLKTKMTVPVRIHVPAHNSSSANITISFFVPPSVATPPSPVNPDVYLESFPSKSIYVLSFGGYALNSDYEKKAKILREELVTLGLSFDDSYGTAAGYNDPLTFFNRHNEVWYTATYNITES